MCKAFSCIVAKSGEVYWQTGIDSHDELIEKFNLRHRDDTTDKQEIRLARVEITPDEGYLYPEKNWTLEIDEDIKPIWWHKGLEGKCMECLELWKGEVYQFNFEEARNPINPLTKKHKPTKQDIDNLKKWVSVWDDIGVSIGVSVGASVGASVWDGVWNSVWNSVGASAWNSVWDSIGASVWDSAWGSVWVSVGAYIGSLFPNIKTWKYTKHKEGEYPFQPAVDLWKRGFVPSFNGKVWRLHSGRKADIVYEMRVK